MIEPAITSDITYLGHEVTVGCDEALTYRVGMQRRPPSGGLKGARMGHRDPEPRGLLGMTITAVEVECASIWRFEFSDGSRIAIEAERNCTMVAYDDCAKAIKPAPDFLREHQAMIDAWDRRWIAGQRAVIDAKFPDAPRSPHR